jgi:hypothetical protein
MGLGSRRNGWVAVLAGSRRKSWVAALAGSRRDVCRVPFVISRPIFVSLAEYEATLRIWSPAVSRNKSPKKIT